MERNTFLLSTAYVDSTVSYHSILCILNQTVALTLISLNTSGEFRMQQLSCNLQLQIHLVLAVLPSCCQVLFTYNEQDDIVLHYLKTFGNKGIMSVENFLSNQTDFKPVVPEGGTSQSEQSSGQ